MRFDLNIGVIPPSTVKRIRKDLEKATKKDFDRFAWAKVKSNA
jgi:hypothetical protein